ncbi:aminoglycoside phosphotransferase family protein [Shimia aestuarii]|uniref:Phosphotransferase enzyme family protein n=1 Tax=Shimia aestuarii TaxID=254406 RepID=A0A1I4K818_9RHOB|nr:aminoglycoside phosphotransferase family protein [Shimia aestuarii]SFL74840.1 Phosphotransferase enzyme family protein [Shimia aestuarii]
MTASFPQSPPSDLCRALPTLLSGETPVRWEKLSGGRTNAAWRGHLQDRDIVLKLYRDRSQNPLFPNLPEAEANLLEYLRGTGLAPALLGTLNTPDARCNVYSHIPGTVWRQGTGDVARMMRRLHGLAVPAGLRACANGSRALLQQAEAILDACNHTPLPASLRPACDIAPIGDTVLLHGDIVPGNLISNDNGLHLIDWQCPAIGDPCEDIAIFLSPAMQQVYRGGPLTGQEIDTFLAAYGAPEITARYRALAPVYHWRMAAYCQWKMEHGSPEYARGLELERAALYDAT